MVPGRLSERWNRQVLIDATPLVHYKRLDDKNEILNITNLLFNKEKLS